MGDSPANSLLFFLIIIGACVLVWTDGDRLFKKPSNDDLVIKPSFFEAGNEFDDETSIDEEGDPKPADQSTWHDLVTLEWGNSTSEYQPTEEYVVINYSDEATSPVVISGWMLENGQHLRLFEEGNRLVTGIKKQIKIPRGVALFTNLGNETLVPIVLQPGEQAIVTTGSPKPIRTKFDIRYSFKTNLCTGYIEGMPSYDFTPSLPETCPDPEEEPGARGLPEDCEDYITDNLNQCHTPKITEYEWVGSERERGSYVDGIDGFSTRCKDYLREHFSYQGCLKYHAADPNFFDGEWRIFLNQNFELWDDDRETITLYDGSGKVVDQISTR